MSNIYHVTTKMGRMDSFFLEADSVNDIVNLIAEISEAEIINIKKIIYSKNFKIGTNESLSPFPKNEDSIYKWSFFCYSNNHSKQIDLYNLKPYTTKQDIEKFLKTQLIVDEPIIGFYDDTREDFKMSNIFDTNLFQIVYKYNSRTYNENFYSQNLEELKKFYDKFVCGELVEIREFETSNLSIKEDDGKYFKRVSLSITDNSLQFKTFIPNIKTNIDFNIVKQKIINYLKFNNKKIDLENINFNLKF